MKKYKRVYLREWDINERAFGIYSNSNLYVYSDNHDNYYIAWNPSCNPEYIGSLKDVESYIVSLDD